MAARDKRDAGRALLRQGHRRVLELEHEEVRGPAPRLLRPASVLSLRHWPWAVHHHGPDCSRSLPGADSATQDAFPHEEALRIAEGLFSSSRDRSGGEGPSLFHGVVAPASPPGPVEPVAMPAAGKSASPSPEMMHRALPTGEAASSTVPGGSPRCDVSLVQAVFPMDDGGEREASRSGPRPAASLPPKPASTRLACGAMSHCGSADRHARFRFTDLERFRFFEHLATMLTVGIPVSRALAALAAQCGPGEGAVVCGKLLACVRSGDSLSLAMTRLRGTFSALEIGVVQAGEAGGGLPLVLCKLAACQERRMTRTRQVVAAVTYPMMVFALALLLLGGVAQVVSRGILPVLDEAGTEVGLGTRLLLAVLDLPAHPLECLLLGGLLVGMTRFTWARLRTPEGRRRVDRGILAIPILGNALRYVEVARVCDSLALLCEAGLPLVECLESTRRVCANSQAADALAHALKAVTSGESLSRGLARGGFFPRVAVQLTAVGEETGRLGDLLYRVAEYSDLEGRAALDRVQAALEPLMVLGIGLAVGMVVLGVLTPLYQAIATLA